MEQDLSVGLFNLDVEIPIATLAFGDFGSTGALLDVYGEAVDPGIHAERADLEKGQGRYINVIFELFSTTPSSATAV
jgi:hypothetical protein